MNDSVSTSREYNHKEIEGPIYERWLKSGKFHHKPDGRGPEERYCIMIPLPNVTGALHLGHALNHTCQDVMIRWNRMKGKGTLWMPGTDHAGIATQSVVERRLFELEGKTRHDIGREALVERIWTWKDQFEQRILSQMKLVGNSCDWERTRFTLDEICTRAVRHTFFKMFRDGLIYRGYRLVNWDTELQTAVADDEVYHEPVKSFLWHVRYPLTDGSGHLTVATTRPETMLGDTAVAVHPEDERYKDLIGKTVTLPLMEREIPVIGDPVLVKQEFGSGCVKVTPAHDPNDYECGLRNELPSINILEKDGRINENGGQFAGLSRDEARKQVVEALEAAGLLESVEEYEHEVGHSDRSKTIIEPYLSQQWFARMGDVEGGVRCEGGKTIPGLAQGAIDAVKGGRIQFFPSRYANQYLDWLSEKRDWCVSRQLWWGHRIPVWYCSGDAGEKQLQEAFAGRDDVVWHRHDDGRWMLCVREGELAADAVPGYTLSQDTDVLDTWFSSALWPYSTLGWPEETAELKYFYPGSVLITTRDIITLWVARMVLSGLYNLGDIPFHHVYVHPKILDGEGQTMSKSKGNGADPTEIIERYGADALRFSLAYMTTESQDIRMPIAYQCPHCPHLIPQTPAHRKLNRLACPKCKKEFQPSNPMIDVTGELPVGIVTSEKFEVGWRLCNKLWQVSTGFVLPALGEGAKDEYEPLKNEDLDLSDRWILSRLANCIASVNASQAVYRYADSAASLYRFFWNEFCDWYVEMAKPKLRGGEKAARVTRQILALVLDHTLRLFQPFIPFITEALWEKLNETAPSRGFDSVSEREPLLVSAAWPAALDGWRDKDLEGEMDVLQNVIRAIRDVRAQVNTARAREKQPVVRSLPEIVVRAPEEISGIVTAAQELCKVLGPCDALSAGPDAGRPENSAARVISGSIELYAPVGDLIDLDAEKKRLEGEVKKIEGFIRGMEGKLSNEKFISRAPEAVVQKERDKLADLQAQHERMQRSVRELS